MYEEDLSTLGRGLPPTQRDRQLSVDKGKSQPRSGNPGVIIAVIRPGSLTGVPRILRSPIIGVQDCSLQADAVREGQLPNVEQRTPA